MPLYEAHDSLVYFGCHVLLASLAFLAGRALVKRCWFDGLMFGLASLLIPFNAYMAFVRAVTSNDLSDLYLRPDMVVPYSVLTAGWIGLGSAWARNQAFGRVARAIRSISTAFWCFVTVCAGYPLLILVVGGLVAGILGK